MAALDEAGYNHAQTDLLRDLVNSLVSGRLLLMPNDDAWLLDEFAKAAGTDVTVKFFENALHAWHTYFPLMPVAEDALKEVVDFMRPHLFPA